MKLKSHVLQGIALSPIAYYLTDLKSAIIFLISFIFIDLDHYFLYIRRDKGLGINKMFRYFDYMWENRRNLYEICFFHTVEFFLALFILGYWRREFWVVLAAFFIHSVLDMYHLYRHGVVFTRAYSFVEYFIRRRMGHKTQWKNEPEGRVQ